MGDFRVQPRRHHPGGACQRDRGPQGAFQRLIFYLPTPLEHLQELALGELH